jgi:WD40 repeat protein
LSHKSPVYAVAFAPDSRTLAAGSGDGLVTLWDPATGRECGRLREPEGHPVADLAFSPDGKRLALLSASGDLTLWDLASPDRPVWSENRHGDSRRKHKRPLVFLPDGASLASGDWEGKVIVWDAATGKVRRTLDFGKKCLIVSLAISPDGKVGIAGTQAGADDFALHVWDPATGETLRTQKDFGPDVAFSPDGRVLADGRRFWDWKKGELGVELDPGVWVSVTAVAFSPDGKVLAVGGFDPLLTDKVEGISLWDTTTGRDVGVLEGHTREVLSLAFSPDGRLLASTGDDQVVKVWALDPPHPPARASTGTAPREDDEPEAVKRYREKYKPSPSP